MRYQHAYKARGLSTIKDLATAAKVPHSTLWFWIQKNIVPRPTVTYGNRVYYDANGLAKCLQIIEAARKEEGE